MGKCLFWSQKTTFEDLRKRDVIIACQLSGLNPLTDISIFIIFLFIKNSITQSKPSTLNDVFRHFHRNPRDNRNLNGSQLWRIGTKFLSKFYLALDYENNMIGFGK